jgi:hypothetical protein
MDSITAILLYGDIWIILKYVTINFKKTSICYWGVSWLAERLSAY